MAIETLSDDISKAFEDLRSIEDSITALGRNDRLGGVRRRFSDGAHDSYAADRRDVRTVNYGNLGATNKRRLVISADNDLYDGPSSGKRSRDEVVEEETRRTVQSSVVMPAIETKSREAAINELKGQEKREVSVRNRRMFSNLLLGTLQSFQRDEKKISTTEKVQAEKQREVERRLKETEMEEKERLAKERMDLLEKRREKEREIKALQRKKAIIQYAEQKVEHLRKLKNFIQTQAKPSIFYLPSKHTLRTLELLKNTSKLMDDRVEHRKRQMEEELKSPEERDKKAGSKEGLDEDQDAEVSDVQSAVKSSIEVKQDENASVEIKDASKSGEEEDEEENEGEKTNGAMRSDGSDEEEDTADTDNERDEDARKYKSGKPSEEVRKSSEERSDHSGGSSDED